MMIVDPGYAYHIACINSNVVQKTNDRILNFAKNSKNSNDLKDFIIKSFYFLI